MYNLYIHCTPYVYKSLKVLCFPHGSLARGCSHLRCGFDSGIFFLVLGFAYMGHMQHLFVHASWWLFSLFDYMLSIEVATLDTSRGLPV